MKQIKQYEFNVKNIPDISHIIRIYDSSSHNIDRDSRVW